MVTFCGVEKEWLRLLEDTNLKYNIKQYGIYFGEMVEGTHQNLLKVYSTDTSLLGSLATYGLSDYAAHAFFRDFAAKI